MSFNDPFQPNVPSQNGFDSMGFWPQFPVSNEQFEVNSQIDDDPPMKRAKNFVDDQLMNQNNRRSPPVNPQSTGRIFFKTRHCVKFRMGQCKNGESCNFAHGDEDLRKPPPNWQELVSGRSEERGGSNGNGNGNENWEDDDSIIHKMKLCKRYYNGEECPYGERCNFLHKDPPRFNRDVAPPPRFRDSSRESAAISIGTTGLPPMPPPQVAADQFEVNRTVGNLNGNVDAARGNARPVYWKTRLCTKFDTTGYCPFGDNCHYAHGQAELLLPNGRPADSEPIIVSSVPLKHVPPPTTDPTPVKTENGFHTDEEGQPKKSFLKLNGKKINRIYGDWLDDMPLIMPNGDER